MLERTLDPKLFCPAHGFCTKTCQETSARAACLYLTDPQETALYTLLAAKGEGAYTRLVMSNGVCSEEIEMQLSAGALRLCSALKQDYPAGSSLTYETTQAAVADMVACAVAAEDDDSDEDTYAKIPGYKFIGLDDDGTPCYEQIPPDCEFVVDGKKVTISDGTITCCDATAEDMSNTCVDGTYCGINSITVKNGQVIHIDACSHDSGTLAKDKNIDPSAAGVAAC